MASTISSRILRDSCGGGALYEFGVCLTWVDTQSDPTLKEFPIIKKTKKRFKDLFFLICFNCSRAFRVDRRKQLLYDKGSISTNIFDC